MFFWKYNKDIKLLTVGRSDLGHIYTVSVSINTVDQLAYWLKFYESVDIDAFRLASKLCELENPVN